MVVRAVVDTNVLVSGLIAGQSLPAQVMDAWLDQRFVLVTSVHQVEELNHVLAYPRFTTCIRLEPAEVDTILAGLLLQAEVVPGDLALPGAGAGCLQGRSHRGLRARGASQLHRQWGWGPAGSGSL